MKREKIRSQQKPSWFKFDSKLEERETSTKEELLILTLLNLPGFSYHQ